jgi:hypothetical protein
MNLTPKTFASYDKNELDEQERAFLAGTSGVVRKMDFNVTEVDDRPFFAVHILYEEFPDHTQIKEV